MYPSIVTISIIIAVVFLNPDLADVQTTSEIEWKNHTSSHHKLSIQYPSNWELKEGKESRFDDYEELYISHLDNNLTPDGSFIVNGSFSVSNVNMTDGPEGYLGEQ